MSWLLAAAYDPFLRATERACLGAWRRELLAPLTGRVLEIGAGTGANLAHYPASLDRLVLGEPDAQMAKRLARRLASGAAPRDAEIVRAGAEALPFPDEAFDAVVSTLVLCSVTDPARALGEVRRVLRPGGALVFLEHVAAEDDPRRLRWQRRLQPVWRLVAGNCHLARATGRSIEEAGFELESLTKASMRRAPPFVRPTIRGRAKKPASPG